jgi:D-3-phosphoglycerate dehydrogenase / 2-oxoglutarate reductase
VKVLFIDSVHPVLSERLAMAGHTCEQVSELDGEALWEQLHDAEGIVIRGRVMLDAHALGRAPRLRFIARAGAGLENIDQGECARRNIRLYNSPEGNRDAVGEHAIGMLLALMNHLPRADREVRGGKWRRKENTGHELNGCTVGIIGFGRMGSALAEKLLGFGVKILAHDKYLKDYAPDHAQETSLDDLLEHADVISLHLPLTPETDGYADAAFFARCKKPVWFINTARGPLVDTEALLDALDNGRVRGACLDTLEYEQRSLLGLRTDAPQPVLQRLFKHDRVLLSPHIAGITHESYFKLANVLADKILTDIADGKL